VTIAAGNAAPFITRVSGPIVTAEGMAAAQMYEVVRVGELGLVGEVVRLMDDRATIQVYEDTTLLRPGAPVELTGAPLSVWLGPGLVGNIFDGIQRPLMAIQAGSGPWIRRGEKVEPLDTARRWHFVPAVAAGARIAPGEAFGATEETPLVAHPLMAPPDVGGVVRTIAAEGDHTIRDTLCVVDTPAGPRELGMLQRWPVRRPRPIRERLRISEPLVTGQRIIDTFFPVGKGGTAAIPGGFGTGKTITQHQLAKWSDADIIVYIGCGERGNEMTEVLREFPEIRDPRSGRPLMERTILIANTSNMPVAAREVSIYTGITLAEYYRDQGRSVAVFADSTSRWAEALRELAARLEEMPAEEGFPASLPTRLAQFYERGGAVATLGGARGAISIVGAVSPPGGDFSEPVTQHTQRFIRCFWALDSELANARHYPSIHWLRSYSEYTEDVADWWRRLAPDWQELRTEAMTVLQREDRLQQIVKLVGPDVLPDSQRLILFVAEMLKDGFLTQSAFDEKDMYCAPARQLALLRMIMALYRGGREVIEAGAPLLKVQQLPCVPLVMRAKSALGNDEMEKLGALAEQVRQELEALSREYRRAVAHP
jgi:V/A-type H+-transporting ATPase subunit A